MIITKITFYRNDIIDLELLEYDTLTDFRKNNIFQNGYTSLKAVNGNTIFYVDMNNMWTFKYHFPDKSYKIEQYMKIKKRSNTIKHILNDHN